MKIVSVTPLEFQGVHVVRFARFRDPRGYFTESFRRADFDSCAAAPFLAHLPLLQMNESLSCAGVIRGLHFQWNPHMGKLVRVVTGHFLDVFLDIRKGSPTLGQAAMYEMRADEDGEWDEWIWVPPGFAHGCVFLQPSRIEYLCSAEYAPGTEASISPLAADIDWSRCDPTLRARFAEVSASPSLLMSDKDRRGHTMSEWLADPRAENFVFGQI